MNRNRWFFDTDFNDDGERIELISIGLVSLSGLQGYYAHSADYDPARCNLWVKQHVLPKVGHIKRVSRLEIRADILRLVGADPEFWAYFADYDWVVLCQLFGPMVDLPKGWPHFCLDLKQEMRRLGIKKEDIKFDAEDLNQHHALDDAKWNRRAFLWLQRNCPQFGW